MHTKHPPSYLTTYITIHTCNVHSHFTHKLSGMSYVCIPTYIPILVECWRCSGHCNSQCVFLQSPPNTEDGDWKIVACAYIIRTKSITSADTWICKQSKRRRQSCKFLCKQSFPFLFNFLYIVKMCLFYSISLLGKTSSSHMYIRR
jgi:hypothetical protein